MKMEDDQAMMLIIVVLGCGQQCCYFDGEYMNKLLIVMKCT